MSAKTPEQKPHIILVVEDEFSLLETLRTKLELEGYTISVATNGEEGLARAISDHPDLILLDILMPKVGGIEMLEALRKDEWGKTAKVLVLTNLSSNTEIARAAELGARDYLIKTDWQIDDVCAKIKRMIG